MKQSGELPAGTLDEFAHVPIDDALDALDHIQRRNVLIALLAHNPQDESPVVSTDSENDADALDDLIGTDQVHLSKLVEYEFITWNRDTHQVTQGPNFDDIIPLLQLLTDEESELLAGWL